MFLSCALSYLKTLWSIGPQILLFVDTSLVAIAPVGDKVAVISPLSNIFIQPCVIILPTGLIRLQYKTPYLNYHI